LEVQASRHPGKQSPYRPVRSRGRGSRKAPTIYDVAAAAGVSKSTVSNVVRGAEDVSAPTRERVLAAIELLAYTPNAIARQFVEQRTTILGVLVGDLSNPYYAQMAVELRVRHSAARVRDRRGHAPA
jgi:DNA-binding LacI/PurR family transcriptional regulator